MESYEASQENKHVPKKLEKKAHFHHRKCSRPSCIKPAITVRAFYIVDLTHKQLRLVHHTAANQGRVEIVNDGARSNSATSSRILTRQEAEPLRILNQDIS